MNAKEYVNLQVERTRGQLRAASFIRIGRNSLRLRGKKTSNFLLDLDTIGRKPIELVDATMGRSDEEPMQDGSVVSADNAFLTDDGMIWDGTSICFRTADGAIVSPDQYEYLKTHTLGPAQLFAEAGQNASGLRTTWKSLIRIAREARNDKAKEILYLTVGLLRWEMNSGKKDARRVHSPLFMIPIREENTGAGVYKFKFTANSFKCNSVLKRELLKQMAVNIYEACDEEIPVSELLQAVAAVQNTVREYIGNAEVDPDAFHLCILDSQDEAICQIVERNMEKICKAPLTQILAGNPASLPSIPSECAPIYPLSADESQQKVVTRVLDGKSVYVTAPAGSGKSQTSVNIAANLVVNGKSVCVMSEKRAANEVFLDYASRIGLDKYCLSINSNMKTADIVRQIKTIVKTRRQFVQPPTAKETLKRYRHAVSEYERLGEDIYAPIPTLGISLFDLISEAIAYPEMIEPSGLRPKKKAYGDIRIQLFDLQTELISTMSETEFSEYFQNGKSGDEELDRMLARALDKLEVLGVDVRNLIRQNHLSHTGAIHSILSNLARMVALDTVNKAKLDEIGNRKVASIYRSLVECSLQMQDLYVALMKQEVTKRIEDFSDDEFVATLEKLKVTKVTPQELFREYGAEILMVCPIVITTPTAASNYIYGTGLDEFDTLVVDEASQMSIISILPYMDRIHQLVVFGDHMQLGITSAFMRKDNVNMSDAVSDTALIDRSVLQAVQGRLDDCSLNYHYRSHTEMLIHISNKTCYDGMLQTIPDIYAERKALPEHLGWEIIRVEEPQIGKKGGNITEAKAIAQRIALLRDEMPDKTIGVIAFNEIQQDMICDKLEELLNYNDDDRLWVRSLEQAQGKEADFVFISIGHCRRNKDGSLHKGISEINRLGGENRLNVLFTRARYKNIVVMSFDYHELKESDNPGVKRLYSYLNYAANGELNELTPSLSTNADYAISNGVSELVTQTMTGFKSLPQVGSSSMAVDVAIRRETEMKYRLGLLMPSFRQTAQETVTKVSVLENAGWNVMPVSPIYFLLSRDVFMSQLEKAIDTPVRFSEYRSVDIETYREPIEGFTLKSLGIRYDSEVEAQLCFMTDDDFLSIDFERVYEDVLSPELFEKSDKELNTLAKEGNTEANLLLLIRLSGKFIEEGKKRSLISNVNRLYITANEKKAGLFFAQLLRTGDIENNKKLIEILLKEAFRMGIGVEDDAE